MIIYGSKATHLNTYQTNLSQCTNCNTSNSVIMSVFSKYAHIYWIPLFPIGKTVVSQCQNCKSTLKEEEMPQQMAAEASSLKSQVSAPKWQFAGLAIIVGIIVFSSFSISKTGENNKNYIANPKVGDKYEFKTPEGEYSTMKVQSVTKDSVYVFHNNYTTNKITGLSKIDADSSYLPFAIAYSKKSLAEKLEKDEIISIDRKE